MSSSLRLVQCFLIGFCVLILVGCNRKLDVETKQGFVEVPGGKIWYEIVGAEKKKTPLLLLHGGPGFTSDYLRPLVALADERPVIFYDQLGAGKSDRPQDTALWKIDRFVDELELLRQHLNLDTVHLFGHSWGTMLITQYLTKSPKGIKTLILAGPCLNAQQWIKDTNLLRSQLPQAIQDSLKWHEDRGTTSSPGYIRATDEFYKRYFCRIPFTADVQKSFDEQSLSVYNTMWGNNEFTATGNLRNFDRTDVLRTISVPTLFTCGRFDEATPATTQAYAEQVKNSEMVVIEEASHQSMNEKPEEYVTVVREFLGKNEE